jgi:hypothetical protein
MQELVGVVDGSEEEREYARKYYMQRVDGKVECKC